MLIRTLALSSIVLASAVAPAACSSSAAGGPVDGPADAHCGTTVQATDHAVCMATGTPPAEEEEHAALFGSEGDDADCKYHVKWSATDVTQGSDVTFTVTATNKTDGSALVGAMPYAEIFLDATHPAPNTDVKTMEDPDGTYTIGPVRFDAPGEWTVRFHFFHHCTDVDEASPHAHVAFRVEVP